MRAVDYLVPGGVLARGTAGWEHRPAQLVMAEAVQGVLDAHGVVLVEAGTGTGKTIAYLLPAILSGRRVVVSTGTKTLQDQIMEHDLPMLAAKLGVEVSAACMKGLSNYLCVRRHDEARRGPRSATGAIAKDLARIERWRAHTARGDKAELADVAEDAAAWGLVTSSPETRIGARCAHYEECFVTAMRRRAEQAQIIVVNHHLYFADLAHRASREGGIIPAHDAVIFDEAHQIEDVATHFFGVSVSTTRLETLVRDAERAFAGARLGPDAEALARASLQAGAAFFQAVPRPPGADAGRAALPPEHFTGALRERMHALDAALEALAVRAEASAAPGEPVHAIGRRATEIRDDIAQVSEGGGGTLVTWTECRGRRVSIGASPVDVSALLREELFMRVPAVVLTSATLAAGGSFAFIESRLGIDFEVEAHALPSPFDYPSQACLYLPGHVPDPRDPAYLEAAAGEILSLLEIAGGGAFVLCTSLRVMHALAERCRSHVKHEVLVQGEAPKALLLDRFRDVGDAVLFATASFWEGVDVPGQALRLVVVDRLPFDVPSDPLVAARCARLEAAGERPFMRYLVPSAALSLKQAFGRLIRTRRDHGIVAILDSRIVRKGYGKVFLASLPDARRCATIDEVRAFWAEATPSAPPVPPR